MGLPELLLTLVGIYIAASLGAELAGRAGLPAVLGELVGGVVIGVSGLRLIDPHTEMIHLLAEVGVVLLIFQVGLETRLADLARVGPRAAAVAAIGVAVPIGLGAGVALAFGLDLLPALLIGAALSATSIGITARVLDDQGLRSGTTRSIVLGAALIDDVVGVALLSVLGEVARTGAISLTGVAITIAMSLGFLLLVLAFGSRLARLLVGVASHIRGQGPWLTSFLAFAFALAWLAASVGSAALIGAFAAGVLLENAGPRDHLENELRPVASVFTPIFFVSIGASVELASLSPFQAGGAGPFVFTLALLAAALVSKVAAGLGAARLDGVRPLVVGVAMLPRGEVGLVFAGVGATTGILAAGPHAALVAVVGLTTFVAPLWLRSLISAPPAPPDGPPGSPGARPASAPWATAAARPPAPPRSGSAGP